MVNRNRPIVRTPRKEKAWATQIGTIQTLTASVVQIASDLLSGYKADMGVNRLSGVTAMRIVGSLSIGNLASATTASDFDVFWGITWVRQSVALAAAGDANIPDPAQLGTRETQWLQRGTLRSQAAIGLTSLGSTRGHLEAFIRLDITQQRKQPTNDYQLVLVVNNGASAAEDSMLSFDLSTMLALS